MHSLVLKKILEKIENIGCGIFVDLHRPIKIKLSRKRLYLSRSVKYLGIKIDENLNWKQNIHDITIKLNRGNAVLSVIRNYVNKLTLRTIYFAIFDSQINYANLIWAKIFIL